MRVLILMTTPLNTDLLNKYQQFVADGYSNPSATTEMKLMNAALGLMGEAGEVADLIKKKLKIMQDPEHLTIEDTLVKWEQQERFTEEIGDVIWYCVHLCSILGIDFQDVIVGNYEKLSKRYKNVYGGKDYGITRHR